MSMTISGVDYEDGRVTGITISGIIDVDNDEPVTAYFGRVVHERWDENGRCTGCGGHAPFWCMASTYYESPYCFECGAKMDGGNDNV